VKAVISGVMPAEITVSKTQLARKWRQPKSWRANGSGRGGSANCYQRQWHRHRGILYERNKAAWRQTMASAKWA
jgi:hypothetical protein